MSTDELVAVFPLPEVVLFPGAVLPLHIFEPRYRTMVKEVLASTRHLSVSLVSDGFRLDPRGQPEMARVAGIGEIVRCDALPDGRFNILVEGRMRARLEEVPFDGPYRCARATPLRTLDTEADPALLRALRTTAHRIAAGFRQFHPAFRFSIPEEADAGAIADACAHALVQDGAARQALLETLDPGERVQACLEALLGQGDVDSREKVLH